MFEMIFKLFITCWRISHIFLWNYYWTIHRFYHLVNSQTNKNKPTPLKKKKFEKLLAVFLPNHLLLDQISYSQSWRNCIKMLRVEWQLLNLCINDSAYSNFNEFCNWIWSWIYYVRIIIANKIQNGFVVD